jgi:DnaJ like chaperone protein
LACKTLGVRVDASMSEVSAAYKQMARAHHPDKVANLPEEDREVSERRMKEINAAYAELKRLRRDLTGWAG